MKSTTSQTLFAYWSTLKAGRPAPSRFEIEPAQLSAILPHTFLLERVDAQTYPFRLAGTQVCERFGTELRGTNFLSGWPAPDRATLLEHFTTIAERAAVGRFEIEAETADGRYSADFEILVLPLTHSRGLIDRFIGSISPLRLAPRLTHEALRACRVIVAECIEPPAASPPSTSTGCQDPFLPHVRHARIVRADRRQFRVYEGGLGRSEPDA